MIFPVTGKQQGTHHELKKIKNQNVNKIRNLIKSSVHNIANFMINNLNREGFEPPT